MNRDIALNAIAAALSNVAWKIGAAQDLAKVEAAWNYVCMELVEKPKDPDPAPEASPDPAPDSV